MSHSVLAINKNKPKIINAKAPPRKIASVGLRLPRLV